MVWVKLRVRVGFRGRVSVLVGPRFKFTLGSLLSDIWDDGVVRVLVQSVCLSTAYRPVPLTLTFSLTVTPP